MKKIAVVGAKGKMGSVVCDALKKDFEIVKIDIGDSLEFKQNIDLVIDFANSETSTKSVKFAVKNNISVIIGSTGQTKDQEKFIKDASMKIAVLKCSNFSIGIQIIKKIIQNILKFNIQDVAIFEKHHREKKDSPSGTALELESEISKNFGGKVQLLAERGGREIGTHKIDFYFGDEVISLEHKAFSRKAFADGVLLSAKFLIGKPAGYYNFYSIVQNEQNIKDI